MKNPLEILRKKLPFVINGKSNLIISIIEPINLKAKTVKYNRTCYYIFKYIYTAFNGVHYPRIKITKMSFPIKKRKYPDQIKYEIVGDFVGKEHDAEYIAVYNIDRNRFDPINYNSNTLVLNFFNEKNVIDTICITNNPENNNVKLLYDATGHHELGYKWKENTDYWKRIRIAAKLTEHPNVIKEQDIDMFEPEPDDRKLINKMHRMQLNEPAQPMYTFEHSTFEFGKRKLSLKRLKLDLKSVN